MLYRPTNTVFERLKSLFKKRVGDGTLAVLGDALGRVEVPDKIGYVYVRFPDGKDAEGFALYSQPTIARSSGAAYPNYAGAAVYVAVRYNNELEIVSAHFGALDQANIDTRVLNPLNQQSKWVYPWQLTYGLASAVATSATASTLIMVKKLRYYVGGVKLTAFDTPLQADKIDLASYIPTTDEHCYAAVWVDTFTNLPVVTTSVAQSLFAPLDETDLQELVVRAASSRPPDGIPFKAFYLANNQTTIVQNVLDVDLRQWLDNPHIHGFPNVLTTLERVWPNRTLVTGPFTTSGVGDLDTSESGAQLIIVHKSNITGSAPGVGDDSGDGYSVGSQWFDTAANILYIASDVTVGAAVWEGVAGSGSGAPFADTTAIVKGSADATKLLRFEVDGFTTGVTRVLTPPDYDGTIATLAGMETLANKVLSQLHLLIGGFKAIFTHAFTADRTVTLPGDANVTLVGEATAQTLTNKTLTTPIIGNFTNATHNHTNAAGGGQITDAALSAAVSIAKGGTGQTSQTPAFDALAPTTTQGDLIYHNGADNVRLPKGTALQHLRMNAAATAPEWATGLIPVWDAFLTPGSDIWNKYPNTAFVEVFCVGGGAQGGGGRQGAAASNRFGGGGGSAGAVTRMIYAATMLSATETLVVGARGDTGSSNGAAAVNTNGGAGNPGGDSFFGGTTAANAIQMAAGGLGGVGGTSGPAPAGGVGNIALSSQFQFYGSSGAIGGAIVSGGDAAVPAYGPGGGGGGGGIDTGNVARGGGDGASAAGAAFRPTATGGGGAGGVGTTGGVAPDTPVTDGTGTVIFGGGGGGGGGGVTLKGGAGLQPGGGGGGGGGSLNGNAGGSGGTGGHGAVYVISYCYT